MSNNYFKFKQFTIYQDKCAMKVCTDACLFGAIIPNIKDGMALDIGAGTGLLSLMFAQRNLNVVVDAIEIDTVAFEQAKQNVQSSKFIDQVNVLNADIKNYEPNKKYNLIFSNPPFYENDLKSINLQRNIAMHSSLLSYEDLLNAVVKLIDIDGIFSVLLPFNIEEKFIEKARMFNLFPVEITKVKQTEKHTYFRTIICFSPKNKMVQESVITIKINQEYSLEFIAYLKDYYLFL